MSTGRRGPGGRCPAAPRRARDPRPHPVLFGDRLQSCSVQELAGRRWRGGGPVPAEARGTAPRSDTRDTRRTLRPVDTSSPTAGDARATARGLGTPGRMVPGCPRSPGVRVKESKVRTDPGARATRTRPRVPARSHPRKVGPLRLPGPSGRREGTVCDTEMGGRCARSPGFPTAHSEGSLQPEPQRVPREGAAREPLCWRLGLYSPGGSGSATVSFLKEGRGRWLQCVRRSNFASFPSARRRGDGKEGDSFYGAQSLKFSCRLPWACRRVYCLF